MIRVALWMLAGALPFCQPSACGFGSERAHYSVGAGQADSQRVFRIHVADGRMGAAVAGVRVQLWYDDMAGPGYTVVTGPTGDAAMPTPAGAPVRVLVMIGGYTDCRKRDRDALPVGYNLELVAEHGMDADNTCGPVAARHEPGELVLYVRPSRWYEKLNQTPS